MRRLIWIAILGLNACTSLYDDRCGPESRDVTAGERIRNAQGDSTGLALVSLGESRDESLGKSVTWYIFGEVLRGHLQSARLVATEDTSNVLLPLPGVPSDPDIILQGQSSPYPGHDFNQLFLRATNGGFTLVLETDLAGSPLIVLPLQVMVFNDWEQPHCS
jgi:hypothetical protein